MAHGQADGCIKKAPAEAGASRASGREEKKNPAEPKPDGKGHGECRYTAAGETVDVAALNWDAWLAQKALQRAAWRARSG